MQTKKLKNDFELLRNICKVIEPNFYDDENNDCYINRITIDNTGERLKLSIWLAYGLDELAEQYGELIETDCGVNGVEMRFFTHKKMKFYEGRMWR